MKTLYCDASFDYKSTERTTENFVRGKIAISDGKGFERIEKVAIGKVEKLQQYINILELTAIARAVELASQDKVKADSLAIYTDSQVAMYWARNGKIKAKVKDKISTPAHESAFEYLRVSRIAFGGIVTFNHVPRLMNHAGLLLEAELEKESPHTK